MRIALFSRHYAEYCLRYAQALAGDHDVLLVLNGDVLSEAPEAVLRSVRATPRLTLHTPSMSIKGAGTRPIVSAIRMIYAFRPDFIQLQEVPDPLTPVVMGLLKPLAPLILTIHDPMPHSGADSRLPAKIYRMRDIGRRLANGYAVHGAWCARALRQVLGDRRPITVSQHGVLMVPEASHPPESPPLFLFFGRIQAYKGLDTLTAAAERLHGDGFRGRICIAGRGDELARFRSRLAVLPFVEIREGFIAPSEAEALFQAATAALLPYKDATQSGVLAAAYGNGRPVIVSNVGGIAEILRPDVNGILIPPDDPAALAAALTALTDEATAARLRAGAAATAATTLDWPTIARDTVAAIAETHLSAAGRREPPPTR